MDNDFLAKLRLTVYEDPDLQVRLFGLTDADEFIAAVLQLGKSSGYALEETSVREAMQAGRRSWFERNLA